MTASDVVLITGCSSGIGRETAKLLAREGYTVYATARRPESIADLGELGCRLLPLDVTDEESATAAVKAVEDAEGAVDVLVNNAGINEIGAMETVPLDLVRRIFETNVFGAIRMCQLVLPGMRRQRRGVIINLGSMLGRFTFPGMGSYCATKHSLEAISDALRHEVRPFGVKVSLIQPGMVRTEFGESAAPERADRITMSGCIMGNYALGYRAVDTGQPQAYAPPPWATRLPPPEAFHRFPKGFAGGQWWLEHPGDIDDLEDPEHARDELIRISFAYWGWIKNHWEHKTRARTYALSYVPYMDARRETRRLVGDYILKQQDAEQGVMFPDRISYGGWSLDVHNPRGIHSGKEGRTTMTAACRSTAFPTARCTRRISSTCCSPAVA